MNKTDFLIELGEILQREELCAETDILEDYCEWDSLSKMAIIAYYNQKFGVLITLKELQQIKTVEDLIKLAGIDASF